MCGGEVEWERYGNVMDVQGYMSTHIPLGCAVVSRMPEAEIMVFFFFESEFVFRARTTRHRSGHVCNDVL